MCYLFGGQKGVQWTMVKQFLFIRRWVNNQSERYLSPLPLFATRWPIHEWFLSCSVKERVLFHWTEAKDGRLAEIRERLPRISTSITWEGDPVSSSAQIWALGWVFLLPGMGNWLNKRYLWFYVTCNRNFVLRYCPFGSGLLTLHQGWP